MDRVDPFLTDTRGGALVDAAVASRADKTRVSPVYSSVKATSPASSVLPIATTTY